MHPTYFVLAIITRGVFDDLKETIQAIIFASRAPISIIFVGMGDADLTELERLGTAGTRLNFHGRKPERDCIQYVSLPKCYEEETNLAELKSLIAERALTGIPWQMSTWMTKNGYKPKSAPVAFSQEVQHDQAFQAVPMQCTYRQPRAGQQVGMNLKVLRFIRQSFDALRNHCRQAVCFQRRRRRQRIRRLLRSRFDSYQPSPNLARPTTTTIQQPLAQA
jgi:hypothetical protein